MTLSGKCIMLLHFSQKKIIKQVRRVSFYDLVWLINNTSKPVLSQCLMSFCTNVTHLAYLHCLAYFQETRRF